MSLQKVTNPNILLCIILCVYLVLPNDFLGNKMVVAKCLSLISCTMINK